METIRSFKHAFLDMGMQDRTLRFRLQGPGSLAYHITRETFLTSLHSIGAADIEGLWKCEDVLEFFVTFRSAETVAGLKEHPVFDVYKGVKAYVTKANESVQFVKFYWVPLYVKNDIFVDYLESKNLKVVSHEVMKDEHGLNSGVRQFRVLGTKVAVNKLPHLLDFQLYNFQTLVRVPGREPMCLKCKMLGHLRNSCPQLKEMQAARASAQQQRASANRRWENLNNHSQYQRQQQASRSPSESSRSTSDSEVEFAENDRETERTTDDRDNIDAQVKNTENNENENKDTTEENDENENKDSQVENDESQNKDDKDLDNSYVENDEMNDSKDSDFPVLYQADGSIACTQTAYFDEKRSKRKLRSGKKK